MPTTTTTNEQGTNVAPAGMTTTASITTPMHFTATAHVPTMMPSIPIAVVRTSSPAANVMQPAGTSTRDNVGIQPLVPPTIGTPSAVSVPLPASHEFISILNPDAQLFVPQSTAHDTTKESGLTANTPNVMADLVEQMYLSRVPAPEPPVLS